jgi:hypothetical protein
VPNRTIPNNKMDIITCDDGKGMSMLTDVIPGDRNVIKKEVKKILKYKYLTTESVCVCVCVCGM